MRTHLLPDAAPLPDDPALVREIIRRDKVSVHKGLGLCIGIEGPNREVYRVIDTDGFVDTIQVLEALHEFGLTPRRGRRVDLLSLQRVFRR